MNKIQCHLLRLIKKNTEFSVTDAIKLSYKKCTTNALCGNYPYTNY